MLDAPTDDPAGFTSAQLAIATAAAWAWRNQCVGVIRDKPGEMGPLLPPANITDALIGWAVVRLPAPRNDKNLATGPRDVILRMRVTNRFEAILAAISDLVAEGQIREKETLPTE